jgi:hypothetical protein
MKLNIIDSIEILRRIKIHFDDLDDYYELQNNLYSELSSQNLGSKTNRTNIINLIRILENNKKYINPNEFNQLYHLLSSELTIVSDISNISGGIRQHVCFTENEYCCLLDKILEINNFNEFLNLKDFKQLVYKNSLFKILLNENKTLLNKNNLTQLEDLSKEKFSLQINPIENYEKKMIVKEIKTLLKICEIAKGKINKVIIVLIIYDTVFKNFKIVTEHEKFKIVVSAKINEIIENNMEEFNLVFNKYNLDINAIYKWQEILIK